MTGRWRVARADLLEALELPEVRRGFLGMCLIVAGSLTPAFLPKNNPLLLVDWGHFMQSAPGRVLGTVLFLTGVTLVIDAWLRLRPGDGAPRVAAWAVLLTWCVPLVFAPPILSADAYSYAAQGQLVHDHMTPYRHGPVDGEPGFAGQVDPVWLYTPAPYGPLALQVNHLVTVMAGHSPWSSALLMRLPAALSVALIAFLVPRLAYRFRARPAVAEWLVTLNPLTVLHLFGGAHNDALMIALMMLAVWLALRGGFVSSAIAVAAAVAIKQTAILILPAVSTLALVQHIPPPVRHPRGWPGVRYVSLMLGGFLVAGVVAWTAFAAITGWTGLGYGWLRTLQVPARVTTASLPTLLGKLGQVVLRNTGRPELAEDALPLARTVGMLASVAVMAWFGIRVLKDPTRPRLAVYLAGAPLATAFGGPALRAWYLLWGGVFLGCLRLTRRQEYWVVFGTVAACGYNAIDYTVRNGSIAMSVVIGVVLLYLLLRHWRWKGHDPLAERLELVDEPAA